MSLLAYVSDGLGLPVDTHNRRLKNMTEFKDLQSIAGEFYRTEEMKKWLFSHTRNETEYQQVRRALMVLSNFHPVQWEGEAGNRHPVEVV